MLKRRGGACHPMGLLSPGGGHWHQDHLGGLARLLADAGTGVRVHALLDGRDTPPRSAEGFMRRFLAATAGGGDIALATVGRRYFAMDRDHRWDRLTLAYDAPVDARGGRGADPPAAIEAAQCPR